MLSLQAFAAVIQLAQEPASFYGLHKLLPQSNITAVKNVLRLQLRGSGSSYCKVFLVPKTPYFLKYPIKIMLSDTGKSNFNWNIVSLRG